MSSKPSAWAILAPLVFALTLSSQSAHAAKESSVHVSTGGFQVIDLDPDDGIAAAVQFTNFSSAVSMNLDIPGFPEYYGHFQNDNLRNALNLGDQRNQFATGYDGGLTGALYNSAQIQSAGRHALYATNIFEFVLTPHTELIFFGSASGHVVSSSATDEPANYASSMYSASLIGDQPGEQSRAAYSIVSAAPGQTVAFSENFRLSLRNQNDVAITGYYRADGGVGAANAVPEPETWAMLLAGLTLMAALARRRQAALAG